MDSPWSPWIPMDGLWIVWLSVKYSSARRRGLGMTTINNSNDGLREFREYCAELFGFDDAVKA